MTRQCGMCMVPTGSESLARAAGLVKEIDCQGNNYLK